MSSDLPAIKLSGVSKEYLIFDKPSHRLWQMLARGRKAFYRTQPVLCDVGFEVRRGETVGLVGRNGSGKSTLLGIVCGTLPATSGRIEVDGRVAALLELGAGFNPELTGAENIDLCAKIYGLTDAQIAERYDSMVAFADIGDYIAQPVKTYSSGMFTRLAFAVVAHVDADILVVDEALAVGDAYFVQKCMRFLAEFKGKGGTLLFVSHDMGSVTALCDRAIWLQGGRVAMDASPKVVANAYLAALYSTDARPVPSAAVPGVAEVVERPGQAAETDEADAPDFRHELLAGAEQGNPIKVFRFTPGHDFGQGGARVVGASLMGPDGNQVAWVSGGELVTLEIEVQATIGLAAPILGFVVKDSRGQPLFGDNTFVTHPGGTLLLEAGDYASARFTFRMPILARGEYSVSIAVADGTQASHIVHEWLHDALVLSSRSDSLATGLLGVPMRDIRLARK